MTTAEPFELLLAIVVGTLATGRVVRLLVDDDYPPVLWLREQYLKWALQPNEYGDGEDTWRAKWAELAECPFCIAPYVALPNILLAWGSGLGWYWWLPNAWAALAYVAAMINVRDAPRD